MVADVTETRNVISSLEFKTCMTIKSYVQHCLPHFIKYVLRIDYFSFLFKLTKVNLISLKSIDFRYSFSF